MLTNTTVMKTTTMLNIITSAITTTSKQYILNTTVRKNVYLTAHSTNSTKFVNTTINATRNYNLINIKTTSTTNTGKIMNTNINSTVLYSIMVMVIIIITTFWEKSQDLELRMKDSATFNIVQKKRW